MAHEDVRASLRCFWEASMSPKPRFGSMNRAQTPSPCPLPSPVHRGGRIGLGRGMKGEGTVFEVHGELGPPSGHAHARLRE
jgi:hypothetical protein